MLPKFSMTFKEFEIYFSSEMCYSKNATFWIDFKGNIHHITAKSYPEYLSKVQGKYFDGYTIKLEKFEDIVGFEDGTVHVFHNWDGGPSFPEHTDPIDVIIYVLDGCKNVVVNDNPVTLLPGEMVHIPANLKHKATNEHRALILSYGMHDNATY